MAMSDGQLLVQVNTVHPFSPSTRVPGSLEFAPSQYRKRPVLTCGPARFADSRGSRASSLEQYGLAAGGQSPSQTPDGAIERAIKTFVPQLSPLEIWNICNLAQPPESSWWLNEKTWSRNSHRLASLRFGSIHLVSRYARMGHFNVYVCIPTKRLPTKRRAQNTTKPKCQCRDLI